MALKLNGTFTTDQGLEVVDPFGFLHFSLSQNQNAYLQFFASKEALMAGRAPINLTGIPQSFHFNYSSEDFFSTPIVSRVHEDIKASILEVAPEGTTIDIVSQLRTEEPASEDEPINVL